MLFHLNYFCSRPYGPQSVLSLTECTVFDLNIFLLQHKAIGIGHKFNNLDRPLPLFWLISFKEYMMHKVYFMYD